MLLPLLNVHCVSFEIEITDGAGFLLFACFLARSVSRVVVIPYGCVHISTFKCIISHWFYREFNKTEGFVVL